MTLIYLYKYLNNILTKKVYYNAAYSFSCSNISFNREKTALQHSKHKWNECQSNQTSNENVSFVPSFLQDRSGIYWSKYKYSFG